MSSDSETNDELNNFEDDTILNKYKVASEIVNKVTRELIAKCVAGSNLLEICVAGDQRIIEETSKIYKKDKDMKKGISFPTCISRNNIAANYSPLSDESAEEKIVDGDLIKLDIGAHIDGYAAIIGHTFVVGASKDNKVTGRKADVILAAQNCAEVALRLIKPTLDSKAVTESIVNTASEFKCKVLENCVTYGMGKDVYENDKTFVINPTDEAKRAEPVQFEVNQAWTVDIVVTTGEAKLKEKDVRTTVYKKNTATKKYQLKLKASRQFFSDVCNKYIGYPFNIRSFNDLTKTKIAVIECANHKLVDPLPVLYENEGEFVAHFRYTVLLTANGPMRLTGLPFDNALYQSTYKVQNSALKTILSEPIKTKKTVVATE